MQITVEQWNWITPDNLWNVLWVGCLKWYVRDNITYGTEYTKGAELAEGAD